MAAPGFDRTVAAAMISESGQPRVGRRNAMTPWFGLQKRARARIILCSPWGYSSAGRALAWHARGQRFDPAYLHHRTSRSPMLRFGPRSLQVPIV